MSTQQESSSELSGPSQLWNWIKDYKFCLFLLVVALLSYLFVLGYQARKASNEARYQVWVTQEIDDGNVILSIAYPNKLRLESPAETRAISIWLQKMTPTPGPSLTPTPTPTPKPNLTATPTLAPIASPIPTATATPHPWTVSFTPHNDGILFTDRDGEPIAPQVALTPGAESAAPAVLYAQRAPLATAIPSTTLALSVYNPDVTPVLTSTLPSAVSLERKSKADWRHFWDLLCGPTTPILVLASSLVAFATKEWRRRSELEKEERRRKTFAEVERLANLASQPKAMLERYWELQERTESELEWRNERVIRRLNEILEEKLTSEDLLKTASEWLSELDYEKAESCINLSLAWGDKNGKASTFEYVLDYVPKIRMEEPLPEENAKNLVRKLHQLDGILGDKEGFNWLLADLVKAQDWEQDKLEELEISGKSIHWLALWPNERPTDPPAVSNWLDQHTDLKFNPFGPERAELDTQLQRYGVSGVFEQARGRNPTVVFGQSGSGKTAAAFLLAYECENPYPSPCDTGSFPMYWSPLNIPNVHNGSFLMQTACMVAQSIARYLVRRPNVFLDLSVPSKYSVVRLLSLWTTSAEHLEAEMQRAGTVWGASERLVREAIEIYSEIVPEQCLSDFPKLLADALPAGFDTLYLIIDLPSKFPNLHIMKSISENLNQLLGMTEKLADRDVYIKLFLPRTLRLHLDLSDCEVSTLAWSKRELSVMLENRIRAAGGYSLTALCGPGVSDPIGRLVRAANGLPRRLVYIGNKLLTTHVQRAPQDPKLSVEDIDSVLGSG